MLTWIAGSGPSFAAISSSKTVSVSSLSKELVRIIRARHPEWGRDEIQVSFQNGEKVIQNVREWEKERGRALSLQMDLPKGERLIGKMVVPLNGYEKGKEVARFHLFTYIHVFQKMVSLRERVARGRPFSESQLVLKRVDVGSLPEAYFTDVLDVVDRESKTSLPAGTVLMSWMIREHPLFKKGEAIQIQAKGEGFLVETKGIALQDGMKDQTIRVRNSRSGRELQAVVLSDQIVEIR